MWDSKSKAAQILQTAAEEHFAGDPEMIRKVQRHPVSQMVAILPFASECENPEDLAAANLRKLFLAEKDPALYPHKPNMTLRARLKPGDTFSTAKAPEVAELGMLWMELHALEDHRRDLKADREARPPKYNPLLHGMSYKDEKKRIRRQMEWIRSVKVEDLITPKKVEENTSIWF